MHELVLQPRMQLDGLQSFMYSIVMQEWGTVHFLQVTEGDPFYLCDISHCKQ